MGTKDNKYKRSNYATEDSAKRRGRSVHTPKAGRGYKSALDRLFDQGVVSDQLKGVVGGMGAAEEGAGRQRLIREARAVEGQSEFNEIISELHTNHRLPDDQKILVRALDHPDETVLEAVLDALIEMDGARPLARREVVKMKLDTLGEVCTSSDLLDLVQMLRARL